MTLQFLPTLNYPEAERPILKRLEALFEEWHQHIAGADDSPYREFADEMVFDGFYPNYFSQNLRVLFVGLEARQIAGYNYLDVLYAAYSKGRYIGGIHLDKARFHWRLLRIAYGLQNGMPQWEQIPNASDIGETFGAKDGTSFAFMNLSKLSNEEDSHSADWTSINAFHSLSERGASFYQREIALLRPQIVITMNIQSHLNSFGNSTYLDCERGVTFWELETLGNRALLIDAFHFSAWNKNDIDDYYEPIRNGVRRHAHLCSEAPV